MAKVVPWVHWWTSFMPRGDTDFLGLNSSNAVSSTRDFRRALLIINKSSEKSCFPLLRTPCGVAMESLSLRHLLCVLSKLSSVPFRVSGIHLSVRA